MRLAEPGAWHVRSSSTNKAYVPFSSHGAEALTWMGRYTAPPPPIPEPWCLWLHPLFGVSAAPRLLLSRTSPECPQCTSTAHTRSHAIRDLPWDPKAQGQALRQTHVSHPKLAPHLAIQTLLTLPALTPPASPAPPPPPQAPLRATVPNARERLRLEGGADWQSEAAAPANGLGAWFWGAAEMAFSPAAGTPR